MSNSLKDKKILDLIGKKEEKRILEEIEQIDKKISLLNIQIPDSLDKKINYLGINPKILKRRKPLYKKVAIFISLLFFSGSLVCIVNPKIALALKEEMIQIISFQTKESLEVNLYKGDNLLNKLEFYIPNGFKKSNYVDDFNKQKVIYENEKDQFIKISIYPQNFLLSLDNEDCEEYTDIKINDYAGKIFIKNNVITILFFDNVSLFEVESNLPKEKILKVAETIHINYEE